MLLLRILLLLGAAYVGACLLLFLLQRALLFLPSREVMATPADAGWPYEPVTLPLPDGASVTGWWVPLPEARGVVLFCHGNAGNIGHRLDTLKCVRALGLSVLLFDYRGYGASAGRPSEAGLYADAEACWRYLTEKKGVPPERIVLWGRSLGAAVAAHLARRRRAAALVLESGFTSVPDLGRRLFPWLPVKLLCRYRFDTVAALAEVRVPVAVIHSPEDDVIPYAMGEALYRAARPPKQFIRIQGDHNTGFLESGAAYLEPLDAFLTEHLGARAEYGEPRPARPR